jgi:hypothetical protein
LGCFLAYISYSDRCPACRNIIVWEKKHKFDDIEEEEDESAMSSEIDEEKEEEEEESNALYFGDPNDFVEYLETQTRWSESVSDDDTRSIENENDNDNDETKTIQYNMN